MMNKRWKIAAVLAVIMVALASNVMGQTGYTGTYPDPNQEATSGKSNTKTATAGLYSEDRDNYLSTTGIGRLTKNLIFVNIFNPQYLGGDYVGGNASFNDRIAGFNYLPYFDAGAGFFIGQWWVGFAFNYGVVETKSEVETASKFFTIDDDGSVIGSTTTENAPVITFNVSDGFKLTAIFGNKTWAVKNDLQIVNSRTEGYETAAAASTFISLSSDASTALNAVNPSNPGNTQTSQPGSVVLKNELTRGFTNSATFRDTVNFGIALGNVIPAAASLSPWAAADLRFGYGHTSDYIASNGYSTTLLTKSGYGWEYESRDELAGTKESASYAVDEAAAHFDLGLVISGGIGLKFKGIFTFSPSLKYDIQFPIYGNKYTGIGGGEETAKGLAKTEFGSTFDGTAYYLAPDPTLSGPKSTEVEKWTADVYELSGLDQVLAPGLKLTAVLPGVNLGINYVPEFKFNNKKQVYKRSEKTVTTVVSGTDEHASYTDTVTTVHDDETAEYSGVIWTNTISIGAQIWLKADKLRLNLGSSFKNQMGNWNTTKYDTNNRQETTTVRRYEDEHQDELTTERTVIGGGETPSSSTSVQQFNQRAYALDIAYNLGLTFFLNENVNFDLLMQSQKDRGENWLELLMPAAWGLQFNIRY